MSHDVFIFCEVTLVSTRVLNLVLVLLNLVPTSTAVGNHSQIRDLLVLAIDLVSRIRISGTPFDFFLQKVLCYTIKQVIKHHQKGCFGSRTMWALCCKRKFFNIVEIEQSTLVHNGLAMTGGTLYTPVPIRRRTDRANQHSFTRSWTHLKRLISDPCCVLYNKNRPP
jgi:hypothetical protein